MTVEYARRRDMFAEAAVHRDTGCHLHPSCLSCPVPREALSEVCPDLGRREAYLDRIEKVRELVATGAGVAEIRDALGVHRATAYRLLNAARN